MVNHVTVTTQVAGKLPSTVRTVIVAVPVLTALTTPLEFTVATNPLLVDQVTLILDALFGVTEGKSVRLEFLAIVTVVKFKLTPVTGLLTLATRDAYLLPSCVVTDIIQEPLPTAVTNPTLLTVATLLDVLAHVTV